MNLKSFNSLFELQQALPTAQACTAYYTRLRWPHGVVSPFDPASKVYHYRNGKYRCRNTGRNFSLTTGTMFECSKIPLQKWFFAIWLATAHKKGISSCQLAKDIRVTQKTAWFMLQRMRECFSCENHHILNGEVELDETFVGGKNKNRHRNKKVKNSQGRSFKDKTPVLGMLERGGKLVCRVVEDTSGDQLTPLILETICGTATLFTDEWCGYNRAGSLYTRRVVVHGSGQYVNDGAYTNTIEGFWSIMKRGIIGIYHKASRKHLHRYVNEYVFRYNTREIDDHARFNRALCNTERCHITYNRLIA